MENSLGKTSWSAEHGNTGTSLLDQAKQQAQPVVQQTQQKAGELMVQARDQLKSQVTDQKERMTGGLDRVAQALRQTSQQLREHEQGFVSPYADTAAEQVERISAYLHERDLDELTSEASSFARSRPALFLAGAFTLGFLATRFLKSSAPSGSAQGQP